MAVLRGKEGRGLGRGKGCQREALQGKLGFRGAVGRQGQGVLPGEVRRGLTLSPALGSALPS